MLKTEPWSGIFKVIGFEGRGTGLVYLISETGPRTAVRHHTFLMRV